MNVSGKTAFITGGASGIGLATAIALGRRAGAVAIVDISADRLREAERAVLAAGARRVTTHLADISQPDQIEQAANQALEAHGGVEIVFANAGVGFLGVPLSQTLTAEARWIFDVNALGVFETARCLLPSMIAGGKPGAFICTASLAALSSDPGVHGALYSATKFAVASLAQGVREACGDAPIQVSVVYPGPINTNIAANVAALRPPGGVETSSPEFLLQLLRDLGISPAAAAEIILEGVEAGLPHISTHPDLSEAAHRRYAAEILDGIEASRRLKSVSRESALAR